MDGDCFDRLTRILASARSRRATLGLAAALGLSQLLAGDARNRKKKKKKRKKKLACPQGQRLCRGACLSVLICCDDVDCAGGRTCQSGTCACPAHMPHLCSGSTECQQCCTKADCTSYTYNGSPECSAAHTCTCSQAGHKYCPGSKHCGPCCADSDCTGGMFCENDGNVPLACTCSGSMDYCQDTGGNFYCVTEGCTGWCERSCETPGAVCCGNLTCQDQGFGDGYRCYPPY